jgi:tetratricopeptide (TPR) repeat protein
MDEVSVRRAGERLREPVLPPTLLQPDDELYTGRGMAFAEIRLGGQYLKLDAQSALKVLQDSPAPAIEIAYGRVWFSSALAETKIAIRARAGAERVVQIRAEGTEYAIEVAGDAGPPVVLVMIDGNAVVQTAATVGRMGPMEAGWLEGGVWRQERLDPANPRAALMALNQRLQWALYYPGVLDPDELPPWDPAGLEASIAAYRRGDLLEAMRLFPRFERPDSDPAGGAWTERPGEEDAAPDSTNALRAPKGESERLYQAALLLAYGDSEEAQRLLEPLGRGEGIQPDASGNSPTGPTGDRTGEGAAVRLAHALEVVIAAVTGGPVARDLEPQSATEWLAESYFQQSRVHAPPDPDPAPWESSHYGPEDTPLRRALVAARESVETAEAARAEGFAFARVRLAEMLFSFGERAQAEAILRPSLASAPDNAAAHALFGYLLLGSERLGEAAVAFQRGIDLNPGLGSGWLGRGLLHFRRGELAAGLDAIQQAVVAEPNRAFYRSYLGQAYQEAADTLVRGWGHGRRELIEALPEPTSGTRSGMLQDKAADELAVARRLDPSDPTAYLFSALQARSRNRINEAVRGLERSIELNDNRALFRSGFLLDQDRAVRGANLAQVFRDAGMRDVSVREASRAVAADYANASGHLFLAASYDALRDPRQVNLRLETPWQTELLIANLLRPVGAGSLSQNVSQQEYSRLFQREHDGIYSLTEYRSPGDWLQSGSVFGWHDRMAYAVDAYYRTQNGFRPNEDSESRTLLASLKLQLAPDDEIYFEIRQHEFESGDLLQYEDPSRARTRLRVRERQEPIVALGYQHRWSDSWRTLFLFSRLDDTLNVSDTAAPQVLVRRNQDGRLISLSDKFGADLHYRGDLEIYSFELQQLWRTDRARASGAVGIRHQFGEFPTSEWLANPSGGPIFSDRPIYPSPISERSFDPCFARTSWYSYNTFEAAPDRLWLTAGLTLDWLEFPENHRFVPVSPGEDRTQSVNPKAGIIVRLDDRTALHAAYTRWLGGVSFDQSFSIEPAQVAGFTQNYRDVFPTSSLGSIAAPQQELIGVLIDRRFPTRTYVGVQWQLLTGDADQLTGVFDVPLAPAPITPGRLSYGHEYREHTVALNVDQLIADDWILNVRYQLTDSELRRELIDRPRATGREGALLHELGMTARWNDASGLFAVAAATWRHQTGPEGSGDDFWQINLEMGYRMLRRRLEMRAGIENLTDQDYRLNPLTPYLEPPRERTFFASLRLSF